MPLCEYFVASPAELETVAAKTRPYDVVPTVDGKGFDVVPIESLAERLGLDRAVEPGPPSIHGDGYEWFVQELTPAMVDALAGVSASDLAAHAEALALDLRFSPVRVTQLASQIAGLAKRAKSEEKKLCMWVSA